MSTASQSTPLMTAEEFGRRPDPGYPEELVRGRIKAMPPPGVRHGIVCGNAYFLLRMHCQERQLGHLATNDSGVITQRGPDTVRGADVSFYSYEKVPRGSPPTGYAAVPPDLVIEVLSPDKRWREALTKVSEDLIAGVTIVVVLDPERRSATVFEGEEPVCVLGERDELTLPAVLGPEFHVPVGRFFE